jgi:membrane-associated phospholipid phosphatase
MARDWLAGALALVAYREMDWFSPLAHSFQLELRWVEWDRSILYGAGFERAIESAGAAFPFYLELCYALVYAVGPSLVAILYIEHRRELVNNAIFLYLLGTLPAYALFPYFPSDPARIVFGGSDMPNLTTPLRFRARTCRRRFQRPGRFFLFLPTKRRLAWGMLAYAASVSVATVYGRYHYAADAAAGFLISLTAAGITILVIPRPRRPRGLP